MTAAKLQPNDKKTEAVIVLSNKMFIHSLSPSAIHIGDADVPFAFSGKIFGVIPDLNLSTSPHAFKTQAYTHSPHSTNPHPCLFFCSLSVRLL